MVSDGYMRMVRSDCTFRFEEKCWDITMFLLYNPSREITVRRPLKYFSVGRWSMRSYAAYFASVLSEGPKTLWAMERPACRLNSPL